MKHRYLLTAAAALAVTAALAVDLAPQKLPAPRTSGGKPLMQALKDRRTTRAYRTDPLPPQVMSDLLWAAFGINRPESGMRTAPSAWNAQEIDIYVFTTAGVFLYDAKQHSLLPVVAGDWRALREGRLRGRGAGDPSRG
jgi:hypothetical protein